MNDSENLTQPVSDSATVRDISAYKNHFALAGKGKGCSCKLMGKVVVIAFLIHEAKSAWKKTDVEVFREVLKYTMGELERQSGLTKNRLSMSYAIDVVPIQRKFERNDHQQIVEDVLKQYGHTSASSYHQHYKKKFKKDESPIIFVINKDFRSFAVRDTSAECSLTPSEWSFVSHDDNIKSCSRILIHEMLHQFGAIDFYYPETVKEVANRLFPNSIMNAGTEIDPLTRYIIGWDEEPDELALQFLDETKNITAEEIAKARAKESDNDW